MKILKLNQKQQKKLLSLCKEFFPELQQKAEKNTRKAFSNGDSGFRLSNEKHNTLVYCSYPIGYDYHTHLFPNDNQNTGIHWYQLCLTELPERIWSKLNNKFHYDRKLDGDFLENYTDFNIRVSLLMKLNIIDSVHPVDFLYDFVKECKKNKYFKK